MKLTKYKKQYRVVTTHVRVQQAIPMLLKGLQTVDDPEVIDSAFLADIDGMIYYSGLFRTDWNISTYTEAEPIIDNITTVLSSSVLECSA